MKHPIPADSANRIKQLRADAGQSQAGLAEKIGVTPAAVAQWESGRAQPSWKRWQQIVRAEALGIHALAETLAALLCDPESRVRLGDAGRRKVERQFRLETMLERTADLYRSTVCER